MDRGPLRPGVAGVEDLDGRNSAGATSRAEQGEGVAGLEQSTAAAQNSAEQKQSRVCAGAVDTGLEFLKVHCKRSDLRTLMDGRRPD